MIGTKNDYTVSVAVSTPLVIGITVTFCNY